MKGRYIPYSAAELAWLEAHKTLARGEYARAFNAKFARVVDAINLHALRKRKGWSTSRDGRFVKGQAPANKGKPCPPGRGGRHPNARRTQFKPGVRLGRAKANYKPIGTERLSKKGYLERKLHDGLPLQSRWRGVHRIRWEEANGPQPKGHCLKCLDGDRRNTDPSNWELIPRAMMPRLVVGKYGHGFDYDAAPAELKPTILAIAKLKHARGVRART